MRREDSRTSHKESGPLRSHSKVPASVTASTQADPNGQNIWRPPSGAHVRQYSLHHHQAKKNETKVQRVEKTTWKLVPEIGCSSVGLIIYLLTSKAYVSESCRIECPGFPDSRDQQNLVSQGQTPNLSGRILKMFTHEAPISGHLQVICVSGLVESMLASGPVFAPVAGSISQMLLWKKVPR